MIEKMISLTKSNVGLLSGLYKSKKLGLTASWLLFCGVVIQEYAASNPVLAAHALYAGAAVGGLYLLGQSWVETHGAKAAALDNEQPVAKP